MKVSELEGAELDYWVAKAEGFEILKRKTGAPLLFGDCSGVYKFWENSSRYSPSTDWSIGGPLIEKYQIELSMGHVEEPIWRARIVDYGENIDVKANEIGPTPLIASMRAIISSVYGESVDE